MKFAATQLEKILLDHYNLKATAQLLYGELDLNFKVTTTSGKHYLLKISGPNAAASRYLEQQELLALLAHAQQEHPCPIPIQTNQKKWIVTIKDSQNNNRTICLISWISGRLWNKVNPITKELRTQLGQVAGKISKTLSTCPFSINKPDFDWDSSRGLWTQNHLDLWNNQELAVIQYFIDRFKANYASFSSLRTQLIHNDLNDNNIFVSTDLESPKVCGIIDFGDSVNTQTINDLAICCSYVMTGFPDPLAAILPTVAGYHSAFNLQAQELVHLYNAIGMRMVISATKAAINQQEQPENHYLQISAKTNWENLNAWYTIQPDFAHFCFRKACGLTAHPNTTGFSAWAKKQRLKFTDLFPTTSFKKAIHLDLSVSSTWIGTQTQFNDLELFEYKIDRLQAANPEHIIAGGYLEPRPLYTDSAYDTEGNHGLHSRSVHLGVDFWLPANTPVHALFKGTVVTAVNDSGNKEYGGLVILEHHEDNHIFYTLHGHLIPESAMQHKLGDVLNKGDLIGALGGPDQNGNWSPHLHFQIMHSMLDYTIDFPGVTYPSEQEIWKDLCPDPNVLFNDPALAASTKQTKEHLLAFRKNHLGKGMSLQYQDPLHIVRGNGVYLIDALGNKYIDTVNNVAHVGHEHPRVVNAGQKQMATLNTNTRYLHQAINELANALLKTLPKSLSVVHFVNSGSEANELALRMVQTVTGSKHMLASEVGYHGNTNACIAVSSYKFDGRGGSGAPKHTHIFPIPDSFSGKHRGPNAADAYANEVLQILNRLDESKTPLGGLILEPILSCGGQIPLPTGFLKKVYAAVREAGGLCISDEVQVGLGRLGDSFWGFEQHGVVPDIITIGKPLGNGHPVAAVVCTQEVAIKFANGMEYFNTFGGNPVSCAIAKEVLEVIQDEKLQENALEVGEFLKSELLKLQKQFPIIADVRGSGFFLGVALCDSKLNPLAKHTSYLANRMKDFGFLMSIDGPDHNVLKIKPPMVFSKTNALQLLKYLEQILNHDKLLQYD